jgi:hypothetical protein
LESPNANNGSDIIGHFGTTLPGFLHNGVGQIYLTMGAMTGMVCHTPKTTSGRLFNWAFMTWNMIVIASYTANLASILTQANSLDIGIKNMEEITAKGLPVCISQGTAYGNWLMSSSRWANGKVQFIPANGPEGCIAELKAGVCSGAIVTDAAAKYHLSKASTSSGPEGSSGAVASSNCGLETAGDIFWKQNFAVGMRQSETTVHQQLSSWIVKMKEQDWFTQLDTKYFESSECASFAKAEDDAQSLKPLHLTGPLAFIVLFALGAILFFHFIDQPFHQRQMQKAIRRALDVFETTEGEHDEVVRKAYKALNIHQTDEVPTEFIKELVLAPTAGSSSPRSNFETNGRERRHSLRNIQAQVSARCVLPLKVRLQVTLHLLRRALPLLLLFWLTGKTAIAIVLLRRKLMKARTKLRGWKAICHLRTAWSAWTTS